MKLTILVLAVLITTMYIASFNLDQVIAQSASSNSTSASSNSTSASSNSTSASSNSIEKISQLIVPHLSALNDAIMIGEIDQALEQARLIEAQLYSATLNRTTITSNNTETFDEDYMISTSNAACYVNEWQGLATGNYYEDYYCLY